MTDVKGFGIAIVLGLMSLARPGFSAEGARVVAAWASGPFEARVAFDKPVPASVATRAVGRTIAYSEKDDRGGTLRIAAARLVDDGRTLVLTTDPHPRAGLYTLELPDVRPEAIRYELAGVEAEWTDGKTTTRTTWPTPDPSEAVAILAGSAEHEAFASLLKKPGRLTLSAMMRFLPQPQPVTLRVVSDTPSRASLEGEPAEGQDGEALTKTPSVFRPRAEPLLLEIVVQTGGPRRPGLAITVQSRDDPKTERLLPRSAFTPTWLPPKPPTLSPLTNVPNLAGGDPKRGAAVFRSEEAKCSRCHKARGEGGEVGPDLTMLAGADPVSVYRDIFEPSARIHPDYVSYTLSLKDGRVMVGTVRAEGADAVKVSDAEAKTTVIPRAGIEEVRPSATSVMPVGLVGAIGEERLRDLIAYLTAPVAK